jgi:uncharacterized integral membrane protein
VADLDPQAQGQGTNWKRWVLGTAILILAIFVAQNAQEVQVDFLFVETTTPLIFALLIATVLGVLIGWLGPRLRRDRD